MPPTLTVNEQEKSRSGSINRLRERTYDRKFWVETDDPSTGAEAVMTAAGIPQHGTFYQVTGAGAESNANTYVTDITAAQASDDGLLWEVTVKYGVFQGGTFPAAPTSWPIKLQWGAQRYERVCYQDKDANPIRNSAKEPFGDPVTVDDSRPVLTIVRNELVKDFSPTLAASYRDTVNNATWNGWAARTVKCASITTSEPQFQQDAGWYYAVTYVFEFRQDTWDRVVLDQGFAELDSGSPARPKSIKGADGHPVNEPVPLNGSGARLATTGTPVFLTFKVYTETDFSVFNLDFSTRLGV